jgi:magnesium-transporting ATPase (P-type)
MTRNDKMMLAGSMAITFTVSNLVFAVMIALYMFSQNAPYRNWYLFITSAVIGLLVSVMCLVDVVARLMEALPYEGQKESK